MFESYAQNGEDVVLWRALKHIEHGTYVDVGAADPDEDSVTKAFYERGWRGVNIEPAPDYAARLALVRPDDVLIEACAGEEDGSIVLHHVVGTGLSSVVDGAIDALSDTSYDVVDVKVRVRRLDDLLVEAGLSSDDPIHFLKIDVEGFEESVIRGLDLSRWRPWVIVAESTKPRSTEQNHHGWEPLLLEADYEFCLFDGLNRYYVAAEHRELRDLLSFPPSVFDQPYLTPAQARLEALYSETLNAYDSQGMELSRTSTQYQELEATHLATVASWNDLEREHNRVVGSWNELETEHNRVLDIWAQLARDHGQSVAECETLRAGVAEMGAEFDQLRADRDGARRELDLIRQTLSWRVTRPLRAVRRIRG